MTRIVAELTPDRWLDLSIDPSAAPQRRRLTEKDLSRFCDWSTRYRQAQSGADASSALLAIGCEMFAWLNGDVQILTELARTIASPPLVVEFAADREPDADAQAWLDAPWEVLACADRGHWALAPKLQFCPVRRLGKPAEPPPPAPHRLHCVFMAAAPEGLGDRAQLEYEAEETAILRATDSIGMDLVVEESGTLPLLSACLAREKPDVAHISCHGQSRPEPGLLLENDYGESSWAGLTELGKLATHAPRLLFVSACLSADGDGDLEPLARGLVQRGFPAVLGWSGSVYDREATLYAAALYRLLAEGADLTHAVAAARIELTSSDNLPLTGSRDWHLARLYLAPRGGGVLAAADGPRRYVPYGRAVKTFLDAKSGCQVSVAGEFEFVGRRRQIQQILREIRQSPPPHAGVLVHGLGRQGKSSLAARVARRLQHTHELVVVYNRYDGAYLLEAFRECTGWATVTEIVQRHRAAVAADGATLFEALVEILSGPCRQERRDAAGQVVSRPVLLVIDDFEQALEATPDGKHRVRSHCAPALIAAIKAFQTADTQSRLLLTSRYQFSLNDGERDWAQRLAPLGLPPMREYESRKQATAKQRAQQDLLSAQQQAALARRLPELIAAARGNPGLQDLLFSLCLQDVEACQRCLRQMDAYLQTGQLPDEEQIRQFLENLAVRSLVDLLSDGQRELLRASTLFESPVPLATLQDLARGAGLPHDLDDLLRLVALSLWEVYADPRRPADMSVAVNALVRPQAGRLTAREQAALSSLVVGDLFACWGGETGANQRDAGQDLDLTRLALLASGIGADEPPSGSTSGAGYPEVVSKIFSVAAAPALRLLADRFAYRQAADWAQQIIAMLDQATVPASIDLLRTAAERCSQVGHVQPAGIFRERAIAQIGTAAGSSDPLLILDHAATYLTHARALVAQGQPDEAESFMKQAQQMLPPGREQAIVLGDIARIRAGKGEIEQALALHQEMLKIFETLGDTRERAVTLGDIARIRAGKGEIEQALALHQERLKIFETLGDQDGIANALWSVAQIELQQQRYQEAFEHLAMSYTINQRLGRLDGICFVGLDLGQLLCAAGQRDEGLQILSRSRDGFRHLGWTQLAEQVESLIDEIQASP